MHAIGSSGKKQFEQPLLQPVEEEIIPVTAAQQEDDHLTGRVTSNNKRTLLWYYYDILDYGATGQLAAFESNQNQASTSSRTGENTTLKANTSEDHNSPGGESKISKPDKNVKTKPSGKVCM